MLIDININRSFIKIPRKVFDFTFPPEAGHQQDLSVRGNQADIVAKKLPYSYFGVEFNGSCYGF